MAVPVTAVVGGLQMRDSRVSLRERDGSQGRRRASGGGVPSAGEGRPRAHVAEACKTASGAGRLTPRVLAQRLGIDGFRQALG
jgi:hypothetical protein